MTNFRQKRLTSTNSGNVKLDFTSALMSPPLFIHGSMLLACYMFCWIKKKFTSVFVRQANHIQMAFYIFSVFCLGGRETVPSQNLSLCNYFTELWNMYFVQALKKTIRFDSPLSMFHLSSYMGFGCHHLNCFLCF